MDGTAMQPLRSSPTDRLSGRIRVPGDKSISHRALIFGALAVGETTVHGLLEGEDVLRTAAAMSALGAGIARDGDGIWHIHGRGVGGLSEPSDVLDMGNSGTGARLVAGVLATHPLTAFMTGDVSLRRRPMGRVARPLAEFGARFLTRGGERLPMAVVGAVSPVPVEYRLPVPSAQVKSAILLAGLNTPGRTTVVEPEPTRDHTETMLRHFGASVTVGTDPDGARRIALEGQPELTGRRVVVPGDPSSAAFALVAACIVPGAEVVVEGIGLNPLRIGLLDCLREMGAEIEVRAPREEAGEPVGDLQVRGSRLAGIDVPPERAPSMIDEYPILAVAAAMAEGTTTMRGLGELRVKESDRLAAMATGLAACGIQVEEQEDALIVHGLGGSARPRGGAAITVGLDHRIAMAFLVLGMVAEAPVTVDDGAAIATSFPDFVALMNGLGARIGPG